MKKKTNPKDWPELTLKIIEHFKGVSNMAKTLNCSRAAIYDWDGVIPDTRIYEIEVKSGGVFTAEQIKREQNESAAA